MKTLNIIEAGVMSRKQMSTCHGGDLFCLGTNYRNSSCDITGGRLASCPSIYESCGGSTLVSCSVKPYGYSGKPGPAGVIDTITPGF